MYKWHQAKLLKEKGVSIKKIARQLKLSRNTVKKYLKSSQPPQFKAKQKQKILDNFESELKEMVSKGFIGTRIFSELVDKGYSGSLATVHRQVASMTRQEKIEAKITTRVETAPGHQMQYDWKEWNLPIGEKTVKIYIHEVILSYSRMKYYTYSVTIHTEDVIRAIEEAIHFFGGTTSEILLDNAKQMVIKHKHNGAVGYNEKFILFCGLYGIEPSACQSYRARTKGKVERAFYYIQEHLLRGLELKELSEFNNLLRDFTKKTNIQIHSTLKESAEERFNQEKKALKALPVFEPTVLYPRIPRKVSNDGYISYAGQLYPVAMQYCLQSVFIEPVFGIKIRVYSSSCQIIGEYAVRINDKQVRPPHPEHEQKNEEIKKKKESKKSKIVQNFIELFGETGEVYLNGLKEKVGVNLYWHLDEIMSYVSISTVQSITNVLAECINIEAYHKNTVKRLLGRYIKHPTLEDLKIHRVTLTVDIKRPLSAYKVEV